MHHLLSGGRLASKKLRTYFCLPLHLVLLGVLALVGRGWGGRLAPFDRGIASAPGLVESSQSMGVQPIENKIEITEASEDILASGKKRLKVEPIEAPHRFERAGRLIVEPVRPGEDGSSRAQEASKRAGETGGLTRGRVSR